MVLQDICHRCKKSPTTNIAQISDKYRAALQQKHNALERAGVAGNIGEQGLQRRDQ